MEDLFGILRKDTYVKFCERFNRFAMLAKFLLNYRLRILTRRWAIEIAISCTHS
ncbi:hypothetical protein [Haloplanus salilacus]|uniref:hypothetical protein n=1 Tax=Haloplanus salilacus TaxID=2949994 RepID=UPI0030D3F37D